MFEARGGNKERPITHESVTAVNGLAVSSLHRVAVPSAPLYTALLASRTQHYHCPLRVLFSPRICYLRRLLDTAPVGGQVIL